MSGREWKPGDVALVECSDGEWRRAAFRPEDLYNEERWQFSDRAHRRVSESKARPLVVIDPEDRDQVERIVDAYINEYNQRTSSDRAGRKEGYHVGDMQAALRSLIVTKNEVFEHLVRRETIVDGDLLVTSLCGKVWKPNDRSQVDVKGKCPECRNAELAGWVA